MKDMQFVVMDTENLPNCFLVNVYNPQNQSHTHFAFTGDPGKKHNTDKLESYIMELNLAKAHVISFNGLRYDNHVIKAFLATPTIEAARKINHEIIVEKKARFETSLFHHEIDVLGILDRQGSLKLYQCRMQYSIVLDSPFPFDKPLAAGDIPKLIEYCQNDCLSTWALFQEPATQSKYKIKLQASKEFKLPQIANKSESDIASDVMASRIKLALKVPQTKSIKEFRGEPETNFTGKQIISPNITFELPIFIEALSKANEHTFNGENHFDYPIKIGNILFNFKQGGLHTIHKQPEIIEASNERKIYDYDISSCYPNLVKHHKIALPGIEKAFLNVYSEILKERLAAKKAGDKAKSDCYKIILNAVYGKFGAKGGVFYNPKSMYSVTMNGQLRLFQIIEKALILDIKILQANTDGITILANENQHSEFNKAMEVWQKETGFELEEVEFEKMVIKHGNSYIAKLKSGKLKLKGDFVDYANLFGGGKAIVIANAVNLSFLENIPVEKTITKCKDIFAFCFYSARDQYIRPLPEIQPKVNRWIWAKKPQIELLKAKQSKSDIKIPDSENIKLANDISLVSLDDIDSQRYIDEAKAFIAKIEHPEVKPDKKSKAEKPQATFDFESDEPEPEPPVANTFNYPSKAKLLKAIEHYKKLGFATIPEFYAKDSEGKARAVPLLRGFPSLEKEKSWQMAKDKINQYPCNIAIRPDDKVVVLDVDTPEKAAAMFGGITLPKTVLNHHVDNPEDIYQLKAKGHLIYKKPAWLDQEAIWVKSHKLAIANTDKGSGEKGTVIELIGGGFKVTVSPSIHKSGVPYKLENAKLLENDLAGLPELPKELWDKFKAIYESQNPPRPPKKTKPLSTKQDRLKEAIKAQVTIYDVLALGDKEGNKVEIYQEGGRAYIKCLWHEENSASCQINDLDSNFAPCKCYGCGKSNDQIAAYMALKEVDFKTALKHLHKIAIKKAQLETQQETRVNQVATASDDEIMEIIANGTSEQITQALIGLRERQIILLEGATGTGKTYAMVAVMIEKAKQGQKCCLLCATIENAKTAFARLKKLMKEQGVSFTCDLVTSDHKSEVSEDDEDDELRKANYTKNYHKVNGQYQIKEYPAQIIITTLGYAGRKGHTANAYLVFHAMIENRFIFVDEADVFFDNAMIVGLQMLARYLLEGNDYSKVNKCPVSSRKGDCSKCILAARLKSPNKVTSERNFSTDFAKESEKIHIERNDIGITSWDSLLDMQSYVEINSTLYYKPLEPNDNIFAKPLELNEDSSYIGFLKHLTENLYNPHIRIEYPKRKKEETPISPDEIVNMDTDQKKQIQFPIMACGIPTLCGVDLVALKQFFGATITKTIGKGQSENEIEIVCQGAKAIVFATATTHTMSEFYSILEQIGKAKDWKTSKTKITDIAFTFNVMLLKTIQHLSIDRIDTLAQEIEKKSEVKMILVGARKKEAYDLTRTLQKKIPDKVMHYFDRAYERQFGRLGRNTLNDKAKIIVLYPKCPSLRGEDFAEVDLMIVDCQQFIPASAIAEIKPGMTSEEKRQKLIEDITRTLLQIIGRVLRSLLERKPGQTVQDDRKIVVMLHGLPDELLGFTLPSEVIHSQQEVIATFISPEPKDVVSSCSEAILDALAGKPIKNYHEMAKAKTIEKAAKEGQDGLSKRERALIALSEDEIVKARQDAKAQKQALKMEAKFIELAKKVKEDTQQSLGWNEIYNKHHLARYKQFVSQLKAIYEDNFRIK